MKPLRRVLAVVCLITFGVQALGLLNFAQAAGPTGAQPAPGFVQVAQGLAQAVAQAQALLSVIQGKASSGADASAELLQLQGLNPALQGLLGQLQGQLDATAQTLQALMQQGNVSGEVLAQFEAFRNNFSNAATQVLNALSALQTPSPVPLGQRAETARGALQALGSDQPLTVTHSQLDPSKLPHRRSDIPRRQPEARPAIIPGQIPPGPADLAPTLDAPITPEIQALAAEKNFDPVELFAFVRNTIEFQPYFGSLKGAQGTLLEKAGNDMDQASLLISLLRASNVPARYVAGVVELPIEKVMNWVGVETPQAAAEAIASNGIPAVARTSADGTITHLFFFHVWVEAFLPQGPGRGAANRSAWVQLNPGFKQHETIQGIDLAQVMQIDLNGFFAATTSGSVINTAESFFTNLNETLILRELDRLAANYTAFVQANLSPTATVRDVLGFRRIKPITRQELNNLEQSFPFKTFTPQLEFAALPSGFRHFVNFAMFGFSKLFALPELTGKRVTVTYVAATPRDQALIDAFGGILNVFPAFIVNLKPELKVEGQLITEGQGVPLGSSQILRSAFLRPLETAFDINDRIVTTGAHYAVSLDFQRVRLDMLRNRAERFLRQLASLGANPPLTSELVEETLHITGLAYFAQTDALSDIVASISRVNYTREPSEAILSQDLLVLFFFGIPVIVLKGSVGVDVKRNIINPTSAIGDRGKEVQFMLASGSFGSAAEHAIFEQLYEIPAVSTERLLMLANRRTIPIFTIDRFNLNQILPRIETFAIVKQNIIEFVSAGFTAIVPQRNQRFHDWLGMGWIVVDPNTGSAGYFIAGNLVSGAPVSAGGSGTIQADASDALRDAGLKLGQVFSLLIAAEGFGLAVEGGNILAQATSAALIAGGLVVFGVGIAMAAIGIFAYVKLGGRIPFTLLRRRWWYAWKAELFQPA